MLNDPSQEELYKLRVNLKTGDTTWVDMPVVNDTVANPKDDNRDDELADDRLFLEPLPRQGFRLKVLPVVDLSFLLNFGDQVEDTVAGIMAYTNLFFKRSADFKIELDVLPTQRIYIPLPASQPSLMQV